MPVICTRVFLRTILDQDSQVKQGLEELSVEVNAFLATLPNLGDALDVKYSSHGVGTNRLLLHAVVIYVGSTP